MFIMSLLNSLLFVLPIYLSFTFSSLSFHSLISKQPSEVSGKRAVLFSYGSGLASALYSVRFSRDHSPNSPLSRLMSTLSDIPQRLSSRKVISPAEFEAIMKLREDTHHKSSYSPVGDVQHLFPGTYYLANVDDKFRRTYDRVAPQKGNDFPPLVPSLNGFD